MAKNARQRRAAKRTLALKLLADARNPTTQPSEGHVRAVWSKTMPPRAHIPFHGAPKGQPSSASRWALDGWSGRGDLPTPPKVKSAVTLPVTPDRADGALDKRAKADPSFAEKLAKWRH